LSWRRGARIAGLRGSGREAASSQWMVWLAQAGLTARGVNYLLIGALAVAIGLGSRGKEADRVGALRASWRYSWAAHLSSE